MSNKGCHPSEILWVDRGEYGIPLLQTDMMANNLVEPVRRWGGRSRKALMDGTYHFYTDDYKFSTVRKNPDRLVNTGARVAFEVNISMGETMARAKALGLIHEKRSISRYWQECGVAIVPDIYVPMHLFDDNLIGIPEDAQLFGARITGGDLDWADFAASKVRSRCATARIVVFYKSMAVEQYIASSDVYTGFRVDFGG